MDRLNKRFESESEYFMQVVHFLHKYKWIYQSANTHILVDGIPEHCVPNEWVDIINFANWETLVSASCERHQSLPEWPQELSDFLTCCWDFSFKMDTQERFENVEQLSRRQTSISSKKLHEVVNFARLIGQHCHEHRVNHVVDIGAGLGYLDRELSDKFQLDVLGLEQDSYRVSVANQRTRPTASEGRAIFKELTLRSQDDLEDQLDSVVDSWFQDLGTASDPAPLCAVGLHACGDLSPTMMKLFLTSQRRPFQSLLLVSCCYHRMTNCREDGTLAHFPISCSLSEMSQTDEGALFLQGEHLKYFFRLAAQETTNRWLNESQHHNYQLYSTFYRALLQLYALREGIHLKKQHRKAVKRIRQSTRFEDYVQQAIHGFGLKGDTHVHEKNLMEIHQQQVHQLPAIETLIILQVLLQPVAEALLLIDRVAYLKENGTSVTLEQVFDDRISPRCFVTVAKKNT